MVLAYSDRISPVPPYSRFPVYTIRVRDYHPLRSHFPNTFHSLIYSFWAPPFSLATTHGITIVLFSSGYLDVSVLRVVSRLTAGHRSSTCRVAPFGHLWIYARLQLPIAFRSLPRPSSSLIAKASTIRPYLLPILIYFPHIQINPYALSSQSFHLLVFLLFSFSPILSKNFLLISIKGILHT